MLDVSGSIGRTRFQIVRAFAEQIARLLDIGIQRSLVGVILFDGSARVHFPVTQHTVASTLLPALNPGLPYSGGGTNIAAALNLLRTAGQTGGALRLRAGYSHIAIVVTDGVSGRAATATAASALHSADTYDQVYAVGVGGADPVELNSIASDPSLVLFNSTFDSAAVSALGQNITQQLCSNTSE